MLSTACLLSGLLALGCAQGRRYDQAVAALVDVSGTYADEKPEVVRILKREVLPGLLPGDTFLVLRIDSESYRKDNLETLVTLDYRPSRANAQKLAVARHLDRFAASDARSEYTDIPGAMMLAAEYLEEIHSGSRVMLVFSDLREELPRGSRRTLRAKEFDGIRMAAVNLKRLHSDAANPDLFRTRVDHFAKTALEFGAEDFRTVMDPEKLPEYLAKLR